jgi:hypothetical protein
VVGGSIPSAGTMKHYLTKLDRWLLRRIFKRIFTQGPNHAENLRQVHMMIFESLQDEFTEDSHPSLYSFNQTQVNEAAFSTLPMVMTYHEWNKLIQDLSKS